MKRSHVYSVGLGMIAGASIVTGRPWLYAAALAGMFLAGMLTGGLLLYVTRLGKRTVNRLDRALPDRSHPYLLAASDRPSHWDWPISEDPDYLDGIERGMRAARRTAGHEDGRIIESDRLAGRDTP